MIDPKYKLNDDEIRLGRMAVILATLIEKSDNIDKGCCIYALLCTLKENIPDDFEEALVTFLKHGTGKDKV